MRPGEIGNVKRVQNWDSIKDIWETSLGYSSISVIALVEKKLMTCTFMSLKKFDKGLRDILV